MEVDILMVTFWGKHIFTTELPYEKELQQTYDYLKQGGFLTIGTLTNKDKNISNSYQCQDSYHVRWVIPRV